jgi:putative ABC transport system substrate-binding protein
MVPGACAHWQVQIHIRSDFGAVAGGAAHAHNPAMDIPRPARRALLAVLPVLALSPGILAQPRERMRRIGYLSGGAGAEALLKPLGEMGWVEGRNLQVEFRVQPDSDPVRLAAVASELVRANVDVLFANLPQRVRALAAATRTIPIVCSGDPDPVGAGLAQSFARPGGNVTGLAVDVAAAMESYIGLLRAVLPRLQRVAFVAIRAGLTQKSFEQIAARARGLGVAWETILGVTPEDVERLIAKVRDPAREAFIFPQVQEQVPMTGVAALAIRRRIVAVGNAREGLLMQYVAVHSNPQRRLAAILDKVLRGENPAEIPFELPDRTELVVNRATARAIGPELSPEILLRATEVID